MEWLAWALGLPMLGIIGAYFWGIRRVALVIGLLLLAATVWYVVVILMLGPVPD